MNKYDIKRIFKIKISNIWLFKSASLIFVIFILLSLYKRGVIALAFINGQPISISDVIRYFESKDKNNIIDKIISEKLIEYEAKKRNIIVKQEEIRSEILKIEKEALTNGKTLAQILKESNQTASDLERNVRLRIIVYKILSQDIDLSEDEIDKFIRENPELYENMSREEAREGVRKLLLDSKIKERYDSWIEEVKASSKIDYFIKF